MLANLAARVTCLADSTASIVLVASAHLAAKIVHFAWMIPTGFCWIVEHGIFAITVLASDRFVQF